VKVYGRAVRKYEAGKVEVEEEIAGVNAQSINPN